MTTTTSYYDRIIRKHKWIRKVLLFLFVFELVVIYDTVRNAPNNSNRNTATSTTSTTTSTTHGVRKVTADNSALSRINGPVLMIAMNPREPEDDDSSNDHDNDNDNNNSNDASEDSTSSDYTDFDFFHDNDDVSRTTARTVHWLTKYHIEYDDHLDYYSGAWLMPVHKFRAVDWKGVIDNLESVSHNAFFLHARDVRMPVDWLDFSVEHTSRYHKSLDMSSKDHNSVAIDKFAGNLFKYIRDTPAKTKALLPTDNNDANDMNNDMNNDTNDDVKQVVPLLHPTIAIVAASTSYDEGSSASPERSALIATATIGATLASLLRAGVGRIVCTIVDDADEAVVRAAFDAVLQPYTNRTDWIASTEMSIVRIGPDLYRGKSVEVHRPRGTIVGLHEALVGGSSTFNVNATYTEMWLGPTHPPSYWKYVYFTEPDLVLQTRKTALPAIHRALEQGRVVMPHRLEPIMHEADLVREDTGLVYDGRNSFVPNEGKFTSILELDGDVDMCCDGGSAARPDWDKADDPAETPCYGWWWDCGFTREWEEWNPRVPNEVLHRRILDFAPFVRLTTGIDIVSLSGTEHQRRCHPTKQKGGEGGVDVDVDVDVDVCGRPKGHGRSFPASESDSDRGSGDE